MYTDRDYADCERRVRRCCLALGICAALFLGLFIAALKLRIRPMAIASSLALFLSVTFVIIYYLIPNVRYRTFLQDLAQGLISETVGLALERIAARGLPETVPEALRREGELPDAETALRRTCMKFTRRWQAMESAAHAQGKSIDAMGTETLEELWQAAKKTVG